MKKLIKRLIRYDYRYNILSQSIFYKGFKKGQARLFAWLYGNPSQDFFVIGVTGTNGKTTTSMLIHRVFNTLVGKTVVVTTEGVYIGTERFEVGKKMTSYDPATLQRILATAKAEGCKIAVIEVSSHGLDQSRFESVDFDMGVLTNLVPEHLDYHKTMKHYSGSKKKLFTGILNNTKKNALAVFPKDDEYGRTWAEEMAFDRIMTYGVLSSAAMKANNVQVGHHGTSFSLQYLGVDYPVSLKMIGDYNVSNVLAALSACVLAGISLSQAIDVVSDFVGVTGRLEQFVSDGIIYYVDYCHNADGLHKALQFLQKLKGNGRLLVLFGLAGNRDVGQRSLAGKYVQQYADLFVLTEDDSDGENRLHIMNDIMEGITEPEGERFFVIPERYYAMKFLVDLAQPGDTVLIAGKGHENKLFSYYGTREWNDMKELRKMLQSS